MAGRYKGQIEVAEDFPYWEYVSVMDSRTRDSHAALNETILRFDDAFWETHYPPAGFSCRCRVVVYNDRTLKRDGKQITKNVPDIEADEGFRNNPAMAWKPDLKRYSSDIKRALQEDLKNEPASESEKNTNINTGLFKTVKEITDKINVKLEYESKEIKKASDKATVKLFNDLKELYKKYPKLKDIDLTIKYAPEGLRNIRAVGMYNTENKIIHLNEQMGAITDKRLKELQDIVKKGGGSSTCKTITDTFRHELGHKLYYEELSDDERATIRDELGFDVSENDKVKKISKYAGQDEEECFSEMFNLNIGYNKKFNFAPKTMGIIGSLMGKFK